MGEIIEVTAIDEEEEKIIESIPRVLFGTTNYQLVISSKRIALIKTGKDYKTIGHFFGDFIGEKMVEKYYKDDEKYYGQNLDTLLKEDINNIQISLDRITQIKLKYFLARYYLNIFGIADNNIEMRLFKLRLEPSKKYREESERMGLNIAQTDDAYAFECQKRIENCLGNKLTQKLKQK
jgi:hypothetical protein